MDVRREVGVEISERCMLKDKSKITWFEVLQFESVCGVSWSLGEVGGGVSPRQEDHVRSVGSSGLKGQNAWKEGGRTVSESICCEELLKEWGGLGGYVRSGTNIKNCLNV